MKIESRAGGLFPYLALLLVTRPAGVAHAQAGDVQLSPAPQARTLPHTPPMAGYNSPAIAINPVQREQVVAAFGPLAKSSSSSDSGSSWLLESRTVAPAALRGYGDTSVAYTPSGTAVMCFTASDGAGPFKYWGNNPKRNGVMIRRSPDGGRTWEPNAISVIDHPGGPGSSFEDQPFIVADAQSGSPYAGNLYVAWSQDRLEDAIIVLSRSVDGGLTWSAPTRISEKAGLPRDDNGTLEGVRGVVAPDGSLHLVWSEASHVVYTVSRDGGRTFSRNRQIVEGGPFHFRAFNLSETNGYPWIGLYSRARGARPDIYVTWADYRNGDVDVFCIASHDGGGHWGRPVRVNNDALHNNADQLFPSLAVDPTNGAVNVLFYDRRRDAANRLADVVLARSTDGGLTFRNYLLSDRSFDPVGAALGEYTGIAAADGRVYGVWTEIVPQGGSSVRPDGRPAGVIRIGVADFGDPRKSYEVNAAGH